MNQLGCVTHFLCFGSSIGTIFEIFPFQGTVKGQFIYAAVVITPLDQVSVFFFSSLYEKIL